jgi:(p)ppGpp synthase/HD superfamily hydrolase
VTASSNHAFILKAAMFAAERHRDQRRKGADREPYVNHLIEVADLLAGSHHGSDAELIAAGFLHDTIEDTCTTFQELVDRFGRAVADLVLEVSDDQDLTKDVRKRLQVDKVKIKSPRAQLLTIADKTANVGSLVRSPPVDWSRNRIREYGDWADAVVSQIKGRDRGLDAAFEAALASLRAKQRV